MKTVRLYIPLALIASSLVLFSLGVKREKAIALQSQTQPATSTQAIAPQSRELDANELITAKTIVESILERNSLDAAVSITGKDLKIEAKDSNAIKNYDGIISFLTALKSLPYDMSYKELCIGQGCGKGISVLLGVKN